VRDGDWKLALDDAKRAELFDLAKDRAEATNVAKDHPEIVVRLTKLALAWKATLPEKLNPACVSKNSTPVKSDPP
jgi:N-acetylgalactosamine-6-sulfatase